MRSKDFCRIDPTEMPDDPPPEPQPDPDDELRVYIVIRKDVGAWMSKPKFGVQCAHAILMLYTEVLRVDPERALQYIEHSQPKIVLQCKDTDQLLDIFAKAVNAGFYCEKVTDLGRTEFGRSTLTAIAIGPVWHKLEAKPSFIRKLRLYQDENYTCQGLGEV